jgi:hypothetical protein
MAKNSAPKSRNHKVSSNGCVHQHKKTHQSDHPPIKEFCELSLDPTGRRTLFSRS